MTHSHLSVMRLRKENLSVSVPCHSGWVSGVKITQHKDRRPPRRWACGHEIGMPLKTWKAVDKMALMLLLAVTSAPTE